MKMGLLQSALAASALALGSCGGGGGGGGGSGDEALAMLQVLAGGTFSPPFTTASVTIGHLPPTSGLTPGTVLFEATVLSTADSGSEFDVAEGDDPDFGGLAAILTNGADDNIGVELTQTGVGSRGVFGQTESSVLPIEAGTVDPDLAGFHVTRVRMFLTDLSLNTATSQYNLVVSFAFYGRPN